MIPCPKCGGSGSMGGHTGQANDVSWTCDQCNGTGTVEVLAVAAPTISTSVDGVVAVTTGEIDWEDFALPGLPVDEDVSLEPGFYSGEGSVTFLNTDGTVRSEAVPVSHVKITTTTTSSGTGFSTTGWPTIPAYPPIAIDSGPPPVPPVSPPVDLLLPPWAGEPTVQLNARIPRSMRQRLKALAAKQDESIQDLITGMIYKELGQEEVRQAALEGWIDDEPMAFLICFTPWKPHATPSDAMIGMIDQIASVHGYLDMLKGVESMESRKLKHDAGMPPSF